REAVLGQDRPDVPIVLEPRTIGGGRRHCPSGESHRGQDKGKGNYAEARIGPGFSPMRIPDTGQMFAPLMISQPHPKVLLKRLHRILEAPRPASLHPGWTTLHNSSHFTRDVPPGRSI